MDRNKPPYNYQDAGFNRFFRRSIDSAGSGGTNTLPEMARQANGLTRDINFDQQPVSGVMANVTKVGTKITLDGNIGRISLADANDNEIGRIGQVADA